MNPYEGLADMDDDELENMIDEEFEDSEDDLLFDGQDLDDLERDGKVFAYGGQKPQEPQKPQSASKESLSENQPKITKTADIMSQGPLKSKLAGNGPSFTPG